MDEARIQTALYNYLLRKGQEIILPNISWSWLPWEADLISITKAKYMYEFEIKISRADFEHDFLKRKHNTLKRISINPQWRNLRIPNYFCYVAPIKAIPICVPDYAGIYQVYPNTGRYKHLLSISEVRKPALLHREKQTPDTIYKMMRTLMFKYWGLAQRLEHIKIQRNIFQREE